MLFMFQQTVEQWTLVFIITSIMLLVPGILYQFFSSSKLQEWNSPTDLKTDQELENICSEEKDKIIDHKIQCEKRN